MQCSLCLEEISKDEETVIEDGRVRHKSCHIEFEEMIEDLGKIYEESAEEDI